jgi:uncharacterized protein with von Willebrand factor type A (vWA) domain
MTAVSEHPFVGMLTDFGRELRAEGMKVGTGDIQIFCSAMVSLDPTDLVDLYWAGRTTLVTRREDIPTYTEVFRRFFLSDGSPMQDVLQFKAQAAIESEIPFEIPSNDAPGDEKQEETELGLMASNVETLRHKAFADCTDDERDSLRKIMAQLKLTPPKRRTRRTLTGTTGRRPDMRRTIRNSMRMHGEIVQLYWRRRRLRLRPLILILDVSGSMSDYSRALLQFAHTAKQASAKVEVFVFGTRLTSITKALQTRSPDEAMAKAAKEVFDWEGGTRIGASLDSFVRNWGRRGVCRGGIVVICSDGLDRGNPEVLATAMDRLSRLCHRIVWLNPHRGNDAGYRPQTLGMMIASPHVDVLLSGHDLSSLQEFAERLPKLC